MVVLIRVVLLLALAACSKTPRPPKAQTDTPENQALLAKLEPYVLCLDQAARVFELADLARAGRWTAVRSIPEPKACLRFLLEAGRQPLAHPDLERAGLHYGESLTHVWALTAARADWPAATDPERAQLVATFDAFDAAHGALFDLVFALNRKVHIDQLARHEQRHGRTLAVLAEQAVLDAEALVQVLGARWDRVHTLDAERLSLAIAAFERSLEDVNARALEDAKEAEGLMEEFWAFRDRGRAYARAARELEIRVRDKVPFTDEDRLRIAANNEGAVAGSPAAAIDAYNFFLEAYRPSKQP